MMHKWPEMALYPTEQSHAISLHSAYYIFYCNKKTSWDGKLLHKWCFV